jgi:pentatricopeptide repeat protein
MGGPKVKKNKKLLPNGKKDRHRNRVPQPANAADASSSDLTQKPIAVTQGSNVDKMHQSSRALKRARLESGEASGSSALSPAPTTPSSFPRNNASGNTSAQKLPAHETHSSASKATGSFGASHSNKSKDRKEFRGTGGGIDGSAPGRPDKLHRKAEDTSVPTETASAERPSSSVLSKMADRVQAVALNKEIAFNANRKDLASATAAFNKAVQNGWANSHTYAAMLNAHVRCGDIDGAEAVFQSLRSHPRLRMDVISCTTMMKGYCASGRMDKCVALLRDMQAHKPAIQPNIRTINTILRGCLSNGLVRECDRTFNMIKRDFNLQPDASSWEYEALMLCEGLQFDKLYPMIGRLKSENILPSSSMMTIYTAVAKALAVIHDWSNCRKYIAAARESIQADADSAHESSARADDPLIDVSDSEDEGDVRPANSKNTPVRKIPSGEAGGAASVKTSKQAVSGGKRAWREVDAARDQSLEVYQQHKRSELLHDLSLLESYIAEQQNSNAKQPAAASELPMLPHFQKTISFTNTEGSSRPPLLKNIIEKLGLDYYLQKKLNEPATNSRMVKGLVPSLGDEVKPSSKKSKAGQSASVPAPVESKIDAVLTKVQEGLDNIFDGDVINFSRLFSEEGSKHVPVKLEICSGTGEWVAQQALADSGKANWVAIEVKHDRVYQTFLRMAFQNVRNLCSIHGDATAILPNHFSPGSVHSVFINHPEPPVQFGGWGTKNENATEGETNDQEESSAGGSSKKPSGDWSQGKHLLSLEFFAQLERVLIPGGTITVVTDNLWYGKMLLRSVASAPHPRLLSPVDVALNPLNGDAASSTSPLSVHDEISGYKLYRGRPGPQVGHVASEASSYFDR